MRQLQPVIWSKGTFLSPQHLQAQERFVEESARFYLDSFAPRAWGFQDIQIDEKALSEGFFLISKASGAFPDALPFEVPGDPQPSARILDECFLGGRKTCLFYLAIPQYRLGGMNVSLTTGTINTRFRADARPVRDENTGDDERSGNERSVAVAQKNLRILAEGENLEGSVVIGCARVEKSPGGIYRVDESYLPPLLNIHAHATLKARLSGLIELLVTRSSQLSGSRRQKNQSLAEFTSSDVANFWLLYTINTHLPGLRHLFESGSAHPLLLFGELCELAGALTAFSTEFEPQGLPLYNHEDLGTCFAELDRLIRRMLETVVPSNFVALPLKLMRDTIYWCSIDKDSWFSGSLFYLAISADIRDPELIDKVPNVVKASSATEIERLVRNALPGLKLVHVPTPPRTIPVKLRQQYFAIEQSGTYWEGVLRARSFAVHAPTDILNPQMELIILLGKPA